MKKIYLVLGLLCLGLGIIGIPLPVLPTTPLVLLGMVLLGKGSQRFHDKVVSTKFYQKYLKKYNKQRGLTVREKATILFVSTSMCSISFIMIPSIHLRITIIILILIEYIYFFKCIKTLKQSDVINYDI